MVPMMEYHIPQEPCSITPSNDHSNRVCFNDSIGTSKWFSQETKGKFEVKINHQHIDMIWYVMFFVYMYICMYIYMYIYMGNMFPETGGFSPPNMEVSDSIFTVQWFMMIQKWAANQPNWDTRCKNIDIHNQPNWVESMSLQKMRVPSDLLIVFPANMDH